MDIIPILGGGLDLEQKILLSQATQNQLSLGQQNTKENPNQVDGQQDSSESAIKEGLALRPVIPEAKPIVIKQAAEGNVLKDFLKKERPKDVSVNYKQVFLDAFLDERPMVLKKVRPVIGDRQRGLKMRGKIIVRVVVNRMGRIESANVLRGLNAYYDDLARQAAMKFTFKPGTIKGNPVRFETSLFFEF